MLKTIFVIAICAIAMGVCYISIAQNTGPNQSVGVVNVDKVMEDYDKASNANAELKAMAAKADQQLNWMRHHALLTDEEITELVKIKIKDIPTKIEETRAAALEDLDNQRAAELRSLQNQPNLNTQQKTKLKELQKYATESGKVIDAVKLQLQKQLAERQTLLTNEVGTDIKVAVGVVSQEKNTPLVLNKSIVIQGGTDITDDVLKRLNAKK